MSAPTGKTCGYSDEHAELSRKILFQRFGQRVMNLKRVTYVIWRVMKTLLFRGAECARQTRRKEIRTKWRPCRLTEETVYWSQFTRTSVELSHVVEPSAAATRTAKFKPSRI